MDRERTQYVRHSKINMRMMREFLRLVQVRLIIKQSQEENKIKRF
jgi:hypothetical protein